MIWNRPAANLSRTLLLVAIVLPVATAITSGTIASYDMQRQVLVLGLALLLPIGLWSSVRSADGPSEWAELGLAIAIFAGFSFSALWHRSGPGGFSEALMYAYFFAATLIGGSVLRHQDSAAFGFVALQYALFVLCAVYGFANLTIYFVAAIGGAMEPDQAVPMGFINIRYWSHLATWGLPILASVALIPAVRSSALLKYLLILTAGIWWWLVFATGARGTLVGLIAGYLLVFVFAGFKGSVLLRAAGGQAVAGLVLFILLSIILPELMLASGSEIPEIRTDSSRRWPLWIETWQMISHHPWIGMGPQAWLTHTPFTDPASWLHRPGHPHNMYLMWWAEYGILPIVLLLLLGAFWLSGLRRETLARPESPKFVPALALSASVGAAAVHASVSAVFIGPASMLLGAVIATLAHASLYPGKPSATPSLSTGVCRRVAALVLAGIVAALSIYWLFSVLRYEIDMEGDQHYRKQILGWKASPRFWADGLYPREPKYLSEQTVR